ncbi:MAG: hypothetical protein H0U56_13240 [Methylibium sp.]|nr:hypothetical protein [Methylibium sp.]
MWVADSAATEGAPPGRSCPLHYRYRAEMFAAPPAAALGRLDVLYVAGGLYGNDIALKRVLELFDREPGRKRLVFNGDFHWFDANPVVFERIQRSVLRHTALRGNVETELAVEVGEAEDDTGCGCAYPDWVGDDVVERSNRILGRLRRAVTPEQRRALSDLPTWLRADVGDFKLGIVHGDAQSLAGWGFAQEHLREAARTGRRSGAGSSARRSTPSRAPIPACPCSRGCVRRVGRRVAGS